MNKIIFHADDYGRSPSISKTIFTCIKKKTISSISIIVSEKIYGLQYLKKTNVNKRLHLNLTDFSPKKDNNDFIFDLSFLYLVLMPFLPNFKINKKKVKNEILRQIKLYKKSLKKDEVFLDGHQHIHMIPWIFNLIFNLRKKNKIINIRIPNEIFSVSIFDLLRFSILKNIFKCFIIKLFIFISKKKIKKIKYNYNFFGIIYSGVQNKKSLNKIILLNKKKNNKTLEILLHPGYALLNEKKLFKKDFFEYYISKYRKKEFALTKSLKLNDKLMIDKIF